MFKDVRSLVLGHVGAPLRMNPISSSNSIALIVIDNEYPTLNIHYPEDRSEVHFKFPFLRSSPVHRL